MHIRAFRALRPEPSLAGQVASVPYDTVDRPEARARVAGNPWSFLRVTRADVEFDDAIEEHDPRVYARGAENLDRFRRAGVLVQEPMPCLYVYRQRSGAHVRRGVVACCRVGDYEDGTLRRHERTKPDKEADRAQHMRALGAHPAPVLLAYRDVPAVDIAVAAVEADAPLAEFTAPDGVVHALWRVPGADGLAAAFGDATAFYIADGHHRVAASARLAREAGSTDDRDELRWFPAVLVPASQLRTLPYNRWLRDLNGLTNAGFLAAVAERFTLAKAPAGCSPRSGQVGMYLAGEWRLVSWDAVTEGDPVAALEGSVLQDRLLAPVAGIGDPRTDGRIEFVGGSRGDGELAAEVDAGRFAAAFKLPPVSVAQMMEAADAGRTMPPKSTWFDPKPCSGLFVHLFQPGEGADG